MRKSVDYRMRRLTYHEDRNCLSWWFPRIAGAGLPVPETRILWTECHLLDLCGGKTPIGFDGFAATIDAYANELGGYPVFLRTGQTSAKHSWKDSCFLPSKEEIGRHVARIVEFSECCDMLGLPHHVWAVRKLLPVEPLFRWRAYGDMPFVREIRVFVRNGAVKYHVPYWPEDAVRGGVPDAKDWEDRLRVASEFSLRELNVAYGLAKSAGAACFGRWSVDCLEADGCWYVTDMAIAELSWGYDEEKFSA